jgi:hypothetical protein
LANQTTTATSRLRPATKALDSTEKSGPAPKYASASPAGIPDQTSAFRTTFARRASAVAVARRHRRDVVGQAGCHTQVS